MPDSEVAQSTETASASEETAAVATETVETQVETPAETPVYDPKPLEAKLSGILSKAFGQKDEEAEPATDDATPKAKDVTDETPAPEAKAEEPEEQEAAATQADAPTLPAAYVRSLKSDGWSDEEIAEHSKLPNFVAVAGKIHDRRNAETAKWAEAGRAIRQQTTAQKPQQQTPPPQATALAPVDVAKLKEQYGDDALIDNIVAPINAVVAQINAILPVVQQTQARSQQAETEATVRQIEGFFSGKEIAPFKDVYGDAESINSDPKAQEARNKVLEMADALIVGAKSQGRSLSVMDALQLAHDSFSSGYKTQAVRSAIKKELKQRNQAITQKPASRATGSGAGGKRNIERTIGEKLAAAFT